MTTYTDVFGTDTVPPSSYGYTSVTLVGDTQFNWPHKGGSNVLARFVDVTASSSGLSLILPPANEVSIGEDILFRNVGAQPFSIKGYGGTELATVSPGSARYIALTNNTTAAGNYAVVSFGVGASNVDAASLVGYGLVALNSTLSQAHPVESTATPTTITSTHRAKLVVYTGGMGTFSFLPAATLGDNFFVLFRNSGSGVVTLDPAGTETIDGLLTLQLQPGESTLIVCDGGGFYTVGLGRSVVYNFTQLVKDVSAGGTIALSSVEASNKLLQFIGSPTSDLTVIIPPVVAVYYVLSALSTNHTIFVKTSTGSGVSVPQNARAILLCDGTNVYSAQTADVSTLVSLPDGSDASPALNFSSKTNTGVYKYGVQGIGIAVNGVARYTDDGTTTSIGSLSGVIKRTSGVESVASGTDLVATPVHAATEKATPTDTDELPIADSSSSWSLKKLTWANLKAVVKTYFDTLYATITHNHDTIYAPKGGITLSGLTQSTGKLLGRTTAGTGAVEEIVPGSGLSLTGGALSCTVTAPVTSVVGQIGDVTSTQIRDALLAVDGSGSGLDADYLDGYHASAFLTNNWVLKGTFTTSVPAGGYSLAWNLYANYGSGLYMVVSNISWVTLKFSNYAPTAASNEGTYGSFAAITSTATSVAAYNDGSFSATVTLTAYKLGG